MGIQSMRGRKSIYKELSDKANLHTPGRQVLQNSETAGVANLVGNKCLMMNYFGSIKNSFISYRRQKNPKMPTGSPPPDCRGDMCLPGNRTQQRSQDFVGMIKVPNQLVLSYSKGRFSCISLA